MFFLFVFFVFFCMVVVFWGCFFGVVLVCVWEGVGGADFLLLWLFFVVVVFALVVS